MQDLSQKVVVLPILLTIVATMVNLLQRASQIDEQPNTRIGETMQVRHQAHLSHPAPNLPSLRLALQLLHQLVVHFLVILVD